MIITYIKTTEKIISRISFSGSVCLHPHAQLQNSRARREMDSSFFVSVSDILVKD